MISCKRRLKKDTTLLSQYIGQTGRTLRERFGEHRLGIQNNTDESFPIHFNLSRHTLNDVGLIPLLKVRNSRDSYHYTMKQHFISTAEILNIGINRTINHNRTSVHTPTLTLYIFLQPVFYPSVIFVNHIRGTVFKLLYINISSDSLYFLLP